MFRYLHVNVLVPMMAIRMPHLPLGCQNQQYAGPVLQIPSPAHSGYSTAAFSSQKMAL